MAQVSENRGKYSPTKFYSFTKHEESGGTSTVAAPAPTPDGKTPAFACDEEAQRTSASISFSVEVAHQKSQRSNAEEGDQNDRCVGRFLALFIWFRRHLVDIFLPYQFPQSVSGDYMAYQIWDSFQAFFSSVCSVLATRAVYEALGVGDAKSTALAATTIVMLEDASAWIGEILFGWAFGRAFDHSNKKWRLFADVGYDLVLSFKLTYPLYASEYLIFIFCATSFFKSFQTIAGDATRAALIAHQARANNIGNVKAKDHAQEKFVKLTGLGTSLMVLYLLDGNMPVIYSIFGGCVLAHIPANYFAIKTIRYEAFNRARLLLCLRHFLKTGQIPSLRRVNRRESVILGFGLSDRDVCGFRINLGERLTKAFAVKQNKCAVDVDVEAVIKNFASAGKPFLVVAHWKKRRIDIVLHEDAQPAEIIEAYVRTVFVAVSKAGSNFEKGQEKRMPGVLDTEITEQWATFRALAVERGYNFDADGMACDDWRSRW